MSDQSMMPEPCDHHWIHYGQPSHSPIRWIVKCSQCNQFRIEDLQEQVDSIEAAAEQRGAERAFRKTQEIIAGFEHTIDEARERNDMINTGHLIQELDTEIQDLTEDDDA